LHDLGRVADLRFRDEQVNMFRHHHVAVTTNRYCVRTVRESKGSSRGYALGSAMAIVDDRNR
jgi:uncharacterized protein YhjY with autotransporter beta-barrel domain